MRSFLPEPGEDEQELLGATAERLLFFGHTHLAFRREGPGAIELVNPGSAGMPFDGDPRAAYGLFGDDGELELRRVEYDREATIAALRARDGEWAQVVAGRIERAAF